MFKNMQKAIFVFCMGSMSLYAQQESSRYDIESAMVLYHIEGGGAFTEDLNITIQGDAKLFFHSFGKVEIQEENFEEVTHGTLHSTEHLKFYEKRTPQKQQSVDFKHQKIVEHPLSQHHITQGLLKQGKETIDGKVCDIWAKEGVRLCIYKGIPLLIEIHALNMFYQKKAFKVAEEIKLSKENYLLPHFPIQKVALFKLKTQNVKKDEVEPFSKKLCSLTKNITHSLEKSTLPESGIVTKHQKAWLSSLGDAIYQKQKDVLPQKLKKLKERRLCLQQATTWIESNSCSTLQRTSWTKEEKKQTLDTLEEEITLLASKMPCIRSAKDIFDLSKCMK